ncbi:MAG: Ig-like domain-containing protein [bacterium]
MISLKKISFPLMALILSVVLTSSALAMSVSINGGNVTTIEDTTFTFSVSIYSGVSPYSYYWEISDNQWNVLKSSTSSSISYTFSTAGTYNIDVTVEDSAVDANGEPWPDWDWDSITATVNPARDTTPPDDPDPAHYDSESMGNADNDTSLDFTWTSYDADSGVQTTYLWVYENGVQGQLQDWDSPYAACVVNGTNGNKYKIKVKIFDAEGNYSIGESAEITIDTQLPTVAITAPSTSSENLEKDVIVNYTASDNRAIFKREISVSKGSVSGNSSGSTWTTEPYDGSADLTVKVYDEAGNYAMDTKNYTLYNPPSAPTDFAISKAENDEIVLTWADNAPADLKEFHIYKKDGDAGDYIKIAAPASGNTYSDTTVTNGKKYTYKICCVDTAGNISPFSNEDSATVKDTIPPGIPSIDSNACWVGNNWVILVWDKPMDDDLAGFNVYYRLYGSGSFTKANTSLITQTYNGIPFYKVEAGLSNFNKYEFAVASQDFSGNESERSEEQELVPVPQAVVVDVDGISNSDISIDPTITDNIIIKYFTGMKTDWAKLRIKDAATQSIVYYESGEFNPHIRMENGIQVNTFPRASWNLRQSRVESKGEIAPAGSYVIEIEASRDDPLPVQTGTLPEEGVSSSSISKQSTSIQNFIPMRWLEVWDYRLNLSGITYSELNLSFSVAPDNKMIADGSSVRNLIATVKRADGTPLDGVPVYFTASGPGTIEKNRVVTDKNGQAASAFIAGTTTGQAIITASLGSSTSANKITQFIELKKVGTFVITPKADSDPGNNIYYENFYSALGPRRFEIALKNDQGQAMQGWNIRWTVEDASGITGEFSGGTGIINGVVYSQVDSNGTAFIYYKIITPGSSGQLKVKASIMGSNISVDSGTLYIKSNSDSTLADVQNGNTILVLDEDEESTAAAELQEKLNQVVPRKKSIVGYVMPDEDGLYDETTADAINKFRTGFSVDWNNEKQLYDKLAKSYNISGTQNYSYILGKETLQRLDQKRKEVETFINKLMAEAYRYADDQTIWIHDPSNQPNPPAYGNPGEAYLLDGYTILEDFKAKLKNYQNISSYNQYSNGTRPEVDIGIDCSKYVQACANAAGTPFSILPNLSLGWSSRIGTWWIYNKAIYKIASNSTTIPAELRIGDIIIIPDNHVVIVNKKPSFSGDFEFEVINAYGKTPIKKYPNIYFRKVLRMPFSIWLIYGEKEKEEFTYGRLYIWD